MKIKEVNGYLILSHLILCVFQIIFWDFIIDDAFISFRYARNLYYHQQLVFNVNETPVEGYSNFLWVLWITLSFALNIEPIIFSKITGIICCHLCILTLYKLALLIREHKKSSNWIVIFYVLTPNIALWSIGGLETSLFSLLLLISVYFFYIDIIKRKDKISKISPFFFVLLSLTRHEGAILFLVTCFYYIYIILKQNKRFKFEIILRLIFYIGSFLIFYLPYFFWRIRYYHSILPQTFQAKRGEYTLDLLIYRVVFFLPIFLLLLPILVLVVVSILKNRKTFFSDIIKTYLFILILTLSVILFLVRSWMPGFRFTIPIIPLIYLLIPNSMNFLIIFKNGFNKRINLWKKIKLITILSICVSNSSLIFTFYPEAVKYGRALKECNIELGKWIEENTSDNASIAIWDVGALPYYANRRTIDIHTNSLQDVHVYKDPYDADYILDQNITFIILNEYYEYIKSDERFKKNYKLIFYAQLSLKEEGFKSDYIYRVYLFKGYYIPESAIDELIESSPRFYK